MKKIIAVILSAALLCTSLAACGKNSTDTDAETTAPVDGMEVVGACLSSRLTESNYANMNAHQTIYVVTPEITGSSQLLFRDNLIPMIAGKNVLILAASVTTGYTAQAATEAVRYYGGTVSGICSIFATTDTCAGHPVRSIFNPNDLKDYASFPSHECPLCKEGKKIEALVNSFGYSALR